MHKVLFLAVALTGYLQGSCCENIYFNLGAGAVFPTENSDSKGDSSTVLYFPTIPGSSLFQLPNVVWKNQYQPGYELYAAVGMSPFCNFRTEGEFLYQNFKRKISGHYDWQEFAAATGQLFDQQADNPLQHASTQTDLYSLLSNVYYDFNSTSSRWGFNLGGGCGIAWIYSKRTVRRGVLDIQTRTPPNSISPTLEKSPALYGTAFAWQFKLGVSYTLSSHLKLTLGYRLFGTTQFRANRSLIVTNPDSNEEGRFIIPREDIRGLMNNSVNASLSYAF